MADDMGRDEISSLSVELQDRTGAQDHGPFNDAFELPDVAGPRVFLKGLHRLLLDRRDLFAQFPGISRYEGLGQQRDVLLPLPQRGDRDGEDVEPIVKVLPKPALADLFLEVSIGRRYDPHIDFRWSGTSPGAQTRHAESPGAALPATPAAVPRSRPGKGWNHGRFRTDRPAGHRPR